MARPDRSAPPPAGELAALRRSLEETQRRLADEHAAVITLRAALDRSTTELHGVHTSLSWRLTTPLRIGRDFLGSLPAFFNEMRGFPGRARYTLATRGTRALLDDIRAELTTRLQRGSLAPHAAPLPAAQAAVAVPFAAQGGPAERRPLHLVLADKPRVTIVIPALNQFDRTYACLASIVERTGNVAYEVVVVDDGSIDETRELEELITGVRVVRNPSSLGFLGACNLGAEAARGDYIVFLNNDTFVSLGWLDTLLAPFAAGDVNGAPVGLVGAKLIYPDGRLQEAGGIVFSDGSAWNYGRWDDPAQPKYEFCADAHYCSGACIMVPRDLFQRIGGFDRRFEPMYYEDVDLAFTMRAAGYRVLYQPQCLIVHFEGGTAGTDTSSGAKRYQNLNRQKLVDKWPAALALHAPAGSNPDIARHRPAARDVLVVDSYTPRPDHDAGAVRMYRLFQILRELGCHVTFVPENRAHDGRYTQALQAEGVEALYHPYLPSLELYLRKAGTRFDYVILSRVETAIKVIDVVKRECPQARLVFDTVDLHFLREQRRAELNGQRSTGYEQIRAAELEVARACHTTLVVSRAERDLLKQVAPDIDVELLSLVVTPDPTGTPFADRHGILFIANFQHPPNCDALEDYLGNIHPIVRRHLPDVPFTVIGAHVPPQIQRLGDSGVRFAGPVTDIRPEFAAARLSVAPLRFGAGIKGKICTSLAFGVPAVTTTIGAEGIDLRHGEDILIADEPEAFADAVVRLHSDAELWNKLAPAGLRTVATQFAPEHARRTLARVLDITLPAGARAPEASVAQLDLGGLSTASD